jgi:hypothetical protein
MNDLITLAESGRAEDLQQAVRERALNSFYYFTKVILGYKDLTPTLHLEVCDFIQTGKTKRQVLLLPRAHFKSTLAKSYAIWRLAVEKIRNGKELAILYARETDDLGKESLREIKGHFETNQILKWIFPEIVPVDFRKTKWTETELIVPRSFVRAEASITSAGVDTAKAGPHYDIIIKDDFIAEAAAESETVMKRSISWHQYSEGMLVDPTVGACEDFLLGTCWTDTDAYAWIEENEPEYSFYRRSAIEDSEPIFPERFSIQTLKRLEKKQGVYKFSCQYMNLPIPPEGGDFKPDQLREYEVSENRFLHIPNEPNPLVPEQLDRVGYLDPSHEGFTGTSEHAVVIVGMDYRMRRIALEEWSKQCGIREAIHAVQLLNDKWYPRWWYEAVGAQRFIGTILLEIRNQVGPCRFKIAGKECGKTHRPLSMQPNQISTKQHKDERIRSRLQAMIEDNLLYLRPGLAKLKTQLLRFPLGKLKDLADALAGAVEFLRRPRLPEEETSEKEMVESRIAEMQPYTNTNFFCG